LLENNILLFCIPSHTSHLFQLLDLYPNSKIKENLQSIHNLKSNPSASEQLSFLKSVEFSVSKSLSKAVINEGFSFVIFKFFFKTNINKNYINLFYFNLNI
jgi:hypothetical protein